MLKFINIHLTFANFQQTTNNYTHHSTQEPVGRYLKPQPVAAFIDEDIGRANVANGMIDPVGHFAKGSVIIV